jgi:hypothetical protein
LIIHSFIDHSFIHSLIIHSFIDHSFLDDEYRYNGMAEDTVTILPGLMQNQREKYGPLLFQKDENGFYTCFFRNCGKKLQANFSRHIARHEQDSDEIDPLISSQIKAMSYKSGSSSVPIQICSHPNHEMWWNASAELPITEFYNRSSKCKKCYIRQQQESKRERMKHVPRSGHSPPPSMPTPKPPPNITPLRPPMSGLAPNMIPHSITPARMPVPGPMQQGTPQSVPSYAANLYSAPPLAATTPFILSRPPREVNRKLMNAALLKKLRKIVVTLRRHQYAWPFNQPVDPVALELDDYFEVIKQPMDLKTIMENLDNNRYLSAAQVIEDIRLVWANAKLYNKVESEIYDFASELSKVFDDIMKKVLEETEVEAKVESEMEQPSDICAVCG